MTKHNLPVWRIDPTKQYKLNWRVDNIYGFFVSIIVSVFAFAGLYYGLSLKIELLNQKVDYLVQQTKEYNERNKEVLTRLGIVEKDVGIIYTKLSIYK